jgi:small GTP-binding protein
MAIEGPNYDYMFKVVAVGESGVGKTNLISMFTKGIFNQSSANTIGVEFTSKIIEVDGKRIKAQLWDTAGQERFRAISVAYYRSAMGGLLVYDVTKRYTFDSLPRWLEELRSQMPKARIMLIGNKVDMADNLREVPIEEAQAFADAQRLRFLETSAKTAENVELAFKELISDIYENRHHFIKPTLSNSWGNSDNTIKPTILTEQKNESSCCMKN